MVTSDGNNFDPNVYLKKITSNTPLKNFNGTFSSF